MTFSPAGLINGPEKALTIISFCSGSRVLNNGDLLTTESQILSSKGEVRRAIQNNALKLNKEKITSGEDLISLNQLIRDKYIILENGKKNKYLFRFN
jgi:tyrosyl-tRNA synthetase